MASRNAPTRSDTSLLELSDFLAKGLDVLFCGINPALTAAQSGHHFSNRNNRFWRVLHLAGFTPHLIAPEDDRTILQYRLGLTAAVRRPTSRADQLGSREFLQDAAVLRRKVLRYKPRALAFLGKPAFAAIFRQREVPWGKQLVTLGSSQVWVLPNPSGLNRSFRLEGLVPHYRELYDATAGQDLPKA